VSQLATKNLGGDNGSLMGRKETRGQNEITLQLMLNIPDLTFIMKIAKDDAIVYLMMTIQVEGPVRAVSFSQKKLNINMV
jgi:hypothetical protein